jgi:hypothetical protein
LIGLTGAAAGFSGLIGVMEAGGLMGLGSLLIVIRLTY